MDLRPGPVSGEQLQGHAPLLPDHGGLVAVDGEQDLEVTPVVRLVRVLDAHEQPLWGSHAATRPVPSHPLEKRRARYSPPSRRSPSTSPYQRARREGSVSADHTSSIALSKRSSIRTMPFPPPEPRLPRMRPPPLALLIVWCSFVRGLGVVLSSETQQARINHR